MKGDKKTVLAIVLVIVAIGVVAYRFLGTGSSATRTAANAIAAPTPSPVAKANTGPAIQRKEERPVKKGAYEELLSHVSEQDLTFRAPAFRNPMSPLVSVAMTGPAIKSEDSSGGLPTGYSIKGIIWNDTAPLALINDQVVGVGERLDDGALITEINPGSVKFTKRGNRFVLVLREE